MPSFREGVKAGLDERDAQRQAAGLCRKQPHRPEPKLCGQRFRRPWEMRVTLGDTITGHKQTPRKIRNQITGRKIHVHLKVVGATPAKHITQGRPVISYHP